MMTQTEIENYFKDIQGINEAKKVFKTLAKQLHPDIGGTETEFKLLNTIYNNILENKIYYSTDAKFDIEIEKIISQILHYENINITIIGSWIWISGDTKPIKDKLKELSFRWAKVKQMWCYGEKIRNGGKTKSMENIRSKYRYSTVKIKTKEKLTI